MTAKTPEQKRDELRKVTIGAKREFEKKLFTFEGKSFEFRQPTIGIRKKVRDKAMKNPLEPMDTLEFYIWCVIELTFVPGTDEKVFSEEDYDTLLESPSGGFMDVFAEECSYLMNVDTETKKKSSKKTTKNNSSSK